MVRQNGPVVNPETIGGQARTVWFCQTNWRFLPYGMALVVREESHNPQHGAAGNGGWGVR